MGIIAEKSWDNALAKEFEQPYMRTLSAFLKSEQQHGKKIFPRARSIFHAFELTPIEAVKVVIVGQDPYHGENQAHGLCFSVPEKEVIPPSLVNIYKELQADLGISPAHHGNLTHWAKQGVLLLNSVLTVEHSLPGSHQNKGWETFTDRVIAFLNQHKTGAVFVLWGAYAKKKGQCIDTSKHLVLSSAHPSPLSVYRGFFGSKPFSTINTYLIAQGKTPIDWALPALY